MSRLFAFGCSFTNYKWPTWADILGKQFDHFENWGKVGAGNSFIFNSIIECHLRKTICKEDVVAIMWSNVSREDRYVNNEWITVGNIYTQFHYDQEFVKKNADTRGYYIRDLAQIYVIQNILSSIGCKYFFLSMMPINNPGQYEYADATDTVKDILPYYKSVLDQIRPSVYEVVFDHDWWSRPFVNNEFNVYQDTYIKVSGPDWPTWEQFKNKDFQNIDENILKEIFDKDRWAWAINLKPDIRTDTHPTPSEHLEYIQKVLPEFCIDQPTIEWVNNVDKLVRLEKSHNHLTNNNRHSIKRW